MGAHGSEHFQRVAASIFQAAAVFVCAHIGQRRDEAGQQIAMSAVQLQPVKTCCNGVAGGLNKLSGHSIHVCARHGTRCLVGRAKGHGTGGNQRPVACGQRFIGLLPTDLGGTLGTAVAQLQTDLGTVA